MRAIAVYIIFVVAILIAVQSTEQIWSFNPICLRVEKNLVEDVCTSQKQFIDILSKPYKQHAAEQKPKHQLNSKQNDSAQQTSLISHFLHGLYAANSCKDLSNNAEQQELSVQLQNYGCNLRRSADELIEKADPWLRKAALTTKEASKGLYFAFSQENCQEVAGNKNVDIKTRFQNVGCKIRKTANEFKELAQPWAEKVVFTTKEAYMGLFDALTKEDCKKQTKSSDSAVKVWFQNVGCSLRIGAENVGKTTAQTFGSTVKHINNIVKEKYQAFYDKYRKKSWSEKTADSMRNIGAAVADKYTLLKQTLGIEEVAKETTWMEKLLEAAKDSGSAFQQKFEELRKTIIL